MEGMKDETSDLLGTLFQWINEAGYDVEELVKMNIEKINSRSLYRQLGRKVSVALIGGAFDPVHDGHIALAKYLLNETESFDEVWLVPCYSHLYGKQMAPAKLRLDMCRIAARIDKRIKVCDYEIVNKLAGETYYFLNKFLEEDFAKNEYRFSYCIGLDNANTFHKWKNFEYLEKLLSFIVVSRQGEKPLPDVDWYRKGPHMFFDAGDMIPELSSTDIRNKIGQEETTDLLPDEIYNLIVKHRLYKE
jgi:nicotinate-nucleotide adenylyltransferase